MKKSFKKYLSLVMVLMVAFVCLFSVSVKAATGSFMLYEDALVEGDYVIYYGGKAMNDTVSSSRLQYVNVSPINDVITDPVDAIVWHIAQNGEYWTIYNATSGKYAAGTGAKNKAQLLTTVNDYALWSVEKTDGGFEFINKANAAAGVNKNLRNNTTYGFACYATGTGGSLSLYKYAAVAESENVKQAKEDVALIESYISMGYSFAYTSVEKEAANVVDTLDVQFTGNDTTSYKEWNSKKDQSSAVYLGNSAGGNDSAGNVGKVIQLRSSNSNSGVVTTASGGTALSITVAWNSATASGRTLNIYGSNTAYTAATDLYNSSTDGDLLGTIVCGTSTTLEIDGEYAYIGFRSASSALYLDSVEIEWAGDAFTAYEFNNSEFRIRCGIDAAVEEIANVESFGIKVTAGALEKTYDSSSEFWGYDEEEGVYYVVISLGDVLTESSRLDVEFTVQAFVVVEDVVCTSTFEKTHSVVSLVETYYADANVKEYVAELYDILVDMGKIK